MLSLGKLPIDQIIPSYGNSVDLVWPCSVPNIIMCQSCVNDRGIYYIICPNQEQKVTSATLQNFLACMWSDLKLNHGPASVANGQ